MHGNKMWHDAEFKLLPRMIRIHWNTLESDVHSCYITKESCKKKKMALVFLTKWSTVARQLASIII